MTGDLTSRWQLETVRATVFARDIAGLDLPNWQSFIGPGREQVNNPSPGTTVEIGPYMGGTLTIGIAGRAGRADLILRMPPTTLPLSHRANNFSGAILEKLGGIAKKWLSVNSNIARLALFATVWQGERTLDDALKTILAKIPSFGKGENEKIIDFFLQINRPRNSDVDGGIIINRLAQWSARMVEILALPGSIWAMTGPKMIPRAQIDIDINTVERNAPISNDRIHAHLDEMAHWLVEIVEHGDRP
jgi:hypothetical protein